MAPVELTYQLRMVDVDIEIEGDGNAKVNDEGSELYRTTSYYNLDRLERTVDAHGNVTEYEYDDLGRQTATIGPQVTIDGTLVRHRTETVYDDRGRVQTGAGQHHSGRIRQESA